MSEGGDVKRRICDAFGVTEDEVDALDRALGGPEVRALRAEGERRVMLWRDEVLRRIQQVLAARGHP